MSANRLALLGTAIILMGRVERCRANWYKVELVGRAVLINIRVIESVIRYTSFLMLWINNSYDLVASNTA